MVLNNQNQYEQIMAHKDDNKQVFCGLLWTFGERISAQLVSTIVTIVLARMLTPEHYGIISIVTVFISFLDVFVSGGLESALIQKKEVDELDFNTAFVISFSLSAVLYGILFVCSPIIADFYSLPELTSVIRVMGLRLPIASFNCIQQAHIRRTMRFKAFFWATLIGTATSGFIGIFMAYTGYEVWALVTQYLTNVLIGTVMLCIVGSWKAKLEFSLQRAKYIWKFGWKVLVTRLVFTLESDIRSLIVGKVFGAADLAYYDQGKKYPSILVTNLNSSINKVMLPAYSKEQDNSTRLLQMLRRSIQVGVYIITPFLIGFAAVAPSFVNVVLTDKWIACVPFIQILSLTYITRPLEESCHQALLAIGRSETVLKCMIAINSVALLFVFVAVFYFQSVLAIAWLGFITTTISLTVFLVSTNKHIGYKAKMQISDILPSLVNGAIMAVIVGILGRALGTGLLGLVLQVLVGAIAYVLGSIVLHVEPYEYLVKKIRGRGANK